MKVAPLLFALVLVLTSCRASHTLAPLPLTAEPLGISSPAPEQLGNGRIWCLPELRLKRVISSIDRGAVYVRADFDRLPPLGWGIWEASIRVTLGTADSPSVWVVDNTYGDRLEPSSRDRWIGVFESYGERLIGSADLHADLSHFTVRVPLEMLGGTPTHGTVQIRIVGSDGSPYWALLGNVDPRFTLEPDLLIAGR